jgi:hypothetical protein
MTQNRFEQESELSTTTATDTSTSAAPEVISPLRQKLRARGYAPRALRPESLDFLQRHGMAPKSENSIPLASPPQSEKPHAPPALEGGQMTTIGFSTRKQLLGYLKSFGDVNAADPLSPRNVEFDERGAWVTRADGRRVHLDFPFSTYDLEAAAYGTS